MPKGNAPYFEYGPIESVHSLNNERERYSRRIQRPGSSVPKPYGLQVPAALRACSFCEIPIPESRAPSMADRQGPRNPKRRSERIRSILRNLRILVSGSTILIISIYKRIGHKARPSPFTTAESEQKKKKMVLKIKRKGLRKEEKVWRNGVKK